MVKVKSFQLSFFWGQEFRTLFRYSLGTIFALDLAGEIEKYGSFYMVIRIDFI